VGRACRRNGETRMDKGFMWGRQKKLLRRPRYGWLAINKIGLRKIEWVGIGRIDLAQDRNNDVLLRRR
jgi:hypothetical protein